MSFWQGPSGRAYMDGICQTLRDAQCHCVAILPPSHQTGFLSAFHKNSAENIGAFRQITLHNDVSFCEEIAPVFCESEVKPASFTDMADKNIKDGRILIIVLPETGMQPDYEEFIKEMGGCAKHSADRGKSLKWSLLCIASPNHRLSEDVGLRIFTYWGRQRLSDLEYIIEQALSQRHLKRADYYWRYSICKGLGNHAPQIVPDLACSSLETREAIADVLRKDPLFSAHIGECVKRFISENHIPLRDPPQAGIALELWQEGVLNIGCDGSLALHPSALLAANKLNAFERLIIEGQIQFFLPKLLRVRQSIIGNLSSRFGTDWRNGSDKEVNEIGTLYKYLSNMYYAETKSERRLAALWRDVRNCMAHNKFLPYNLAIAAICEHEQFSKDSDSI